LIEKKLVPLSGMQDDHRDRASVFTVCVQAAVPGAHGHVHSAAYAICLNEKKNRINYSILVLTRNSSYFECEKNDEQNENDNYRGYWKD